MHRPNWTLFAALWALTMALWAAPYLLHAAMGFNVEIVYSLYPWNFSPLYGVCLFGGAWLPGRLLASLVPAAAYLLGNVAIFAVTGRADWAFYEGAWANYLLFALLPWFGRGLSDAGDSLAVRALGRGVGAAVFYFVASNLLLFAGGDLYPRTMAGLVECFTLAIPFFPATFASCLAFTVLLFSPVGVRKLAPAEAPAERPVPSML